MSAELRQLLDELFGHEHAWEYYKVLGPTGNFHGAPGSGLAYTNVLRDFSLARVTVGIDIRRSSSDRRRPQ